MTKAIHPFCQRILHWYMAGLCLLMLLLPMRQHSPRPTIPWGFFPCRLANNNQPSQHLGPITPTGHWLWAPRPTPMPSELSLATTNSQSPGWHQGTPPCPGWFEATLKAGTPAPTFVIWKDELCEGYEEEQKERELLSAKQQTGWKARNTAQAS